MIHGGLRSKLEIPKANMDIAKDKEREAQGGGSSCCGTELLFFEWALELHSASALQASATLFQGGNGKDVKV